MEWFFQHYTNSDFGLFIIAPPAQIYGNCLSMSMKIRTYTTPIYIT